MERRKLLFGAAATAIGTSALVGSGAFTRVEAERDLEVTVADDSAASLGLAPCGTPNGAYVDDGGWAIVVVLSSSNSNLPGDGLNADALTDIDDMLQVTNQGTQGVWVWVRFTNGAFETELFFYDGADSQKPVSGPAGPYSGSPTALYLCPGDSVCLGLEVDTNEQGGTERLDAVLHAGMEPTDVPDDFGRESPRSCN